MAINSILILGAGELGGCLAHSLMALISQLGTSRKPTVTVLISGRPNSRADELAGLDISIIRHDITNLSVSGLSAILRGYDAVVSCIGFAAGPGAQIKIAQAAITARVGRFIPWQFGVDYDAIGRGSGQDLFDEQLNVRELLRTQSGHNQMDWVIVSTGVFTSFLFEDAFGVVDGAISQARNPEWQITVRALGHWGNGLTVTSVSDIGRLTARILFDHSIHQQIVYLAGDTISYERLVRIIQRATGKAVRKELWTQEMLYSMAQNNPHAMNKYRMAFGRGRGVSWPMVGTYNAQLGIETINVETWLKQQLRARGV